MEILRCEALCKVYGSGEIQVKALDGLDLSVEKGAFVAVVGASGSGKSTLLHILASVDQPTSGRVVVDGVDLSTLDPTRAALFRRRKVGFVFQGCNKPVHSFEAHCVDGFPICALRHIPLTGIDILICQQKQLLII